MDEAGQKQSRKTAAGSLLSVPQRYIRDMSDEIEIAHGVPTRLAVPATELYCQAFVDKLRPFLGDEARAAAFLAPCMVLDRAFVACRGSEVLGIAGFKLDGRGLFEPSAGDFIRSYGLSGVARMAGLAAVERPERPDVLLMDGIAVSAAVRGQGIGTRLLQAIEDHARVAGKSSVRLDVIDTNSGARRLYERFGFEAGPTTGIGIFRLVFPFRASTEMVKRVDAQ